MPSKNQSSSVDVAEKTLVVDNGAYTIKAGFATSTPDASADCRTIPNCIARGKTATKGQKIYIADQLDDCKDFAEMAFRRPVEKGFVVNWDAELDIWKQVFFNKGAKLQCDPTDTNLVLTEAPSCNQALQSNTDQVIFEELEVASAYRCVGPSLNAYNDMSALTVDPPRDSYPAECLLIIDSGYSHTTVTPLLRGRPVQAAIKRLDIGGKHLTNYLKEIISLRHIMVMDEPHLILQMKEDACFVSQDFRKDLETIWRTPKASQGENSIAQEYVLPDYVNITRGYLRPRDPSRTALSARLAGQAKEDFVPLSNERILVPEIIFSPSDIGMAQAGLAEVVVQSLSCLPAGIWPAMLANIVVVGGNAKISGFVKRFEKELRALTPAECVLRVRSPADPITYTWLGGARFAADKERLKKFAVTRQEYQEHGEAWTARKFAQGAR